MLKLIIGLKGSGKTKQLIELANKAVEVSPGNVVCVEKSNKLIFDVNHKVRLVDTEAYNVAGASELFGLVAGVLATNYDVKDLFIDSALKICGDDVAAWVEFMGRLEKLCAKYEVQCVCTSSIDQADLPKVLEQYVF
ncbi:MAG: ATP-binding protein [Clostridia bacterium]|nr:ATP-binding protein [Clostridia bacterium]